MYSLLLSILFLATGAFVFVQSWFTSDEIPGPIAGRLTQFYRVWLCLGGTAPLRYAQLFQKYGPVVRTGPNHVSLFKAECIPIVYDVRYRFKKSNFYWVFRLLYRGMPMDTIFTVKHSSHQQAAKRLLIANMTSVPAQFTYQLRNSVHGFVQRLRGFEGSSIDLWEWCCFWAFDLSHHLVFGQDCGYLERGIDFNGMITALFDVMKGASILGQIPEYGCIFLGNIKAMSIFHKIRNAKNPVELALRMIEEKIRAHNSELHECGKALICRIFAGRSLEKESEYREVINILFEAFFAPALEGAVSLNCVLYALINHPTVYKKLCDRLRAGCKSRDASFNHVGDAYLEAVVKESLRLHTPNSMPMERVAPADFSVDGYIIPENTIVSIHPYNAHRDPDVYGEDAEAFRPERWLQADERSAKSMEGSFMAAYHSDKFGKGRRACSGRELAMLQLRFAVSGILETLDLQLASKEKEVRLKMYWVIEFCGFKVTFTDANKHHI